MLILSACSPRRPGFFFVVARPRPQRGRRQRRPAESDAPTGFAACGDENAGTAVIGGVTDVGRLDDKSFNEAGWCGTIKGGTAVGGSSKVIVTKDKKDYQTNMKLLIDEGAKIIVTYGFALGADTAIAAKANPDVNFVGIDQFICVDEAGAPAKSDPLTAACLGKGDPAVVLPNYQGLVFNEAQAGYLAGVLAGSLTKSNVIGTVGGIFSIPPVPQYMGGFENGALSVNPSITVLSDFVSTDIAKAFVDPVRGKAIADQMVGAGADVLFQVAGGSGQGVLQAACDNNLLASVSTSTSTCRHPTTRSACSRAPRRSWSTTRRRPSSASSTAPPPAATSSSARRARRPASAWPRITTWHRWSHRRSRPRWTPPSPALQAGTVDPCKGPGTCFFDPDK